MKQPNFDKRADQSLKSKKYKYVMPMTNFKWNLPVQYDNSDLVNYGEGNLSQERQNSIQDDGNRQFSDRTQNYKRAVETIK